MSPYRRPANRRGAVRFSDSGHTTVGNFRPGHLWQSRLILQRLSGREHGANALTCRSCGSLTGRTERQGSGQSVVFCRRLERQRRVQSLVGSQLRGKRLVLQRAAIAK
jgi:hypothetical protein